MFFTLEKLERNTKQLKDLRYRETAGKRGLYGNSEKR